MMLFNCFYCECVDKNYAEILANVHKAIDHFIETKCDVEPTKYMYLVDFQLDLIKFIRTANKPLSEMINNLRPDIPAVIEKYMNSKKHIKVRGIYICGLELKTR